MTDVFNETLRSWQNFYFMAGGAAATLLGLMFVAISLGIDMVTDENRQSIHTFVTPSIFYFVSALLLSGVMLVPAYTPPVLGLILVSGGIFGLVRIVPFVRRLIGAALKHQDFDLAEWLGQIVGPVFAYVLIVLAGAGFVINQWSLAFIGLWIAIILLLLAAISNTWSLVLWIVEQRSE